MKFLYKNEMKILKSLRVNIVSKSNFQEGKGRSIRKKITLGTQWDTFFIWSVCQAFFKHFGLQNMRLDYYMYYLWMGGRHLSQKKVFVKGPS